MISIITSIYNQLAMNQLYYESLQASTQNPFELIIIDNGSSDGSREYFEKQANVKLIALDGNYNYPYCQNRGIEKSRFEWLCFFNNDIILPNGWDEKMLKIMESNPRLGLLSFASNDHLENKKTQKKLNRKWKRIKYPLQKIWGNSRNSLSLMLRLMYRDFQAFADRRFDHWGYELIEGYSGSAILMKKEILEKVGLWDERIQGADFDLFNRVKTYANHHDDLIPIQLALGIYIHHFQRLTVKQPYPPFANRDQMIRLEEKWGEKTKNLRADIVG